MVERTSTRYLAIPVMLIVVSIAGVALYMHGVDMTPATTPTTSGAANTTAPTGMKFNGTIPSGGFPGGNWTKPIGVPPGGFNSTRPSGVPPGGMNSTIPGGFPGDMNSTQPTLPPDDTNSTTPGGTSGTTTYKLSGSYTLDGGSATQTDTTYTSDATDTSAVYATNGADLTLIDPTITTSGDTSSSDASSFYGLNAAVLATGGSTITIEGGTITTTGTGANGAFPADSGSTITLTNTTIDASGNGGHGVMASGGGTLILNGVDITTSGASSAAVATDRGSGTVTVTGGTLNTSGMNSPSVYSTGNITITGATGTATGSEAIVVEGSNTATLIDTILACAKKWGVMLYNSMSGDASAGTSTFTMSGGSLTVAEGPAIYVTNTVAVITLENGADITAASGILLEASEGSWGTSGSNGGTATLTADAVDLNGDITADASSTVTATLQNGATLTGAVTNASIKVDATSTWTLTGDSTVNGVTANISGTTITNITGNGYSIYYDAALAENSYLGGLTYTLVGGGELTPSG
jgi:hypothetical protein